jgi:hypothetical protein
MPIKSTEGKVEIPLAVNLTDKEYDDIAKRGQDIATSFKKACLEEQVKSFTKKEVVEVVEGKVDSPLDDPEEIRTFVVNKLLLEADAGDSKNRMRALELLGKVGEVGLFVEKKEVVHKNYKEEEVDRLLEQKIKELMHEKTIEAEVLTLEDEAKDITDAEYVEE